MPSRRRPKPKFPPAVRLKCLLWCARHCCLCGKNCGLDIELHHLDESLPLPDLNKIDNAIPVCYYCHADLERSKSGSPRGSKYVIAELKARREQIYEEHTRHLVPVLNYGPVNGTNVRFPKVPFHINNTNGGLCVQVSCTVEILVNGKFYGTPVRHYSGKKLWACNPGLIVTGNFSLVDPRLLVLNAKYKGPAPDAPSAKDVRIRAHMTIIDAYGRGHDRLPVEWYYRGGSWVFDP